jgi:tRNA-specific 2-thiouridylase
MTLAKRICAQLGIPFYVQDVRDEFYHHVVQNFIEGYGRGITPNPCIHCNREIRFGILLERALSLNADYLATGHYARLERETNGSIKLLRAVDIDKDQSYVLSVLNQAQLKHALFPLGEYTKSEVRDIAIRMKLPVADRADSQDLCFLAGEDYRDFLMRITPEIFTPGQIISSEGVVLGEHRKEKDWASRHHAHFMLQKKIVRTTRSSLVNMMILVLRPSQLRMSIG